MPATKRIESTASIAQHAPALRELRRARRRDAKLARRIERAREGGDDKALAHLCDIQSRSYSCRLSAAWEMNRKRKKGQRFSPARLLDIAANADPHDMTARPVTVRGHGKDRAAVDPGPGARVVHEMVSRQLRPWVLGQLHPAQFKFRGGCPMACRALLEHMRRGTWATVLDVRDFYPSCDAESLAATLGRELHLRPAMARAAICEAAMRLEPSAKKGGRPPRKPARQKRGFYLNNPKVARACQTAGGEGKGGVPPKEEANPSMSPGDVTLAMGAHVPYRNGLPFGNDAGGCQPRRQTKTKTTPTVCRRGLMLGSSASDLVAEWIMGVVLKALPDSTRVVCYADNVIVICHSREGAREVKQTLTRALAQSPAGKLTFGTRRVVKLGDGFEFLGYHFHTVRGVPTAEPTDENHKVIFDRFAGHVKRRQYGKARRSIERWVPQFGLWPAIDDWRAWALSEVDDAEAGRWEPPETENLGGRQDG